MKPILFATLCALLLPTTGCIYQRVGDLNMVSTRNVDLNRRYKLLERYQTAKVRADYGALEKAIEKVVKDTPGGEFAMNVKIYVKANGKKVKVEADVWGLPGARRSTDGHSTRVDPGQDDENILEVGDWVSWTSAMGVRTGQIVGLTSSEAILRVPPSDEVGMPMFNQTERRVTKHPSKLTKVQAPTSE